MTALKTILAATDFSAHARHATDRAALLAHETGARLTLMHALSGSALAELRQWLGAGHAGEQQLVEQTRRSLEQAATELGAARRVAVHTHLGTGAAVDCIGQQADAVNADLLVMGGYGHPRAWELTLGGVTRTMLQTMTLPVLMSH